MEKQTIKKTITLSFLTGAVLTYLSVNTVFKSLAGAFSPVQRLYSIEALQHGLPVTLAFLVFVILQFNSNIVSWAEEVVLEVSKVVWPSRRDTFAMTIVVCVFVGIASLMLIVIDFFSRELVRMIIN